VDEEENLLGTTAGARPFKADLTTGGKKPRP